MKRWLLLTGTIFITALVGSLCIEAGVLHVPAGTDQIGKAVLRATAGDTLLLTTDGGIYHETDRIVLPAIPLTIMADTALISMPTWTTDGTRHIRAYHNLLVKGIRFDGRDRTGYAIRSYAPRPNTIVVDGCEIANFLKDGITDNDIPVDTCIVRNTLFRNIGQVAVEFRTADMCRTLIVENCTFFRLGEHAIQIEQEAIPIKVRISNITVHDGNSGIYLNEIKDAEITGSIITGCRTYAVKAVEPVSLSYICTFGNRVDFDIATGGRGSFNADPKYFDPEAGDFSILPGSPCLTAGIDGGPIGDLRWVGQATIRAGRRRLLRTWGTNAGIALFAVGALCALYLLMKRQISSQEERKAFRKAYGELEIKVAERTNELKIANRQLQQEIAEHRRTEGERRQLERQLIHSERMTSVGTVAAGIVHNLKNPLTGILGYSDILRIKHPGLPEAEKIAASAERMGEMVEGILAKSRQRKRTEPVDLNALLERELDFLQADSTFKHEVEKNIRFAEGLPPVVGVYTDFSQIFGNLLRNAVDAMRGRKQKALTVTTSFDGTCIRAEVTDTGCGIPKSGMPHLFEAFFTTKSQDEGNGGSVGTGLGLYMVQQLLKPYDAEIEVESAVDAGTTFRVKIPASAG